MTIKTLFPIFNNGKAVGRNCLALARDMAGDGTTVEVMVPTTVAGGHRPFVRDAVPPLLRSPVYRLGPLRNRVDRLLVWRYARWLRPGDVAYVWPGAPADVARRVKDRGATLVTERINCHTATAKRILDEAYARVGLPPTHGINDDTIRREQADLALADFAFCPGPQVERSMLEAGVPAAKLLVTSYGWDPARFPATRSAVGADRPFTVLFVGLACVRKGVHLLLDAWAKSGLTGRLVLAGHVDQEIATACRDHLARPDVHHLKYVEDIGKVYADADVFAFPSLEEGSPLVSYEAIACGLPMLVSPMGGTAVVRDGVEGWVRDPYDTDAWVTALRQLAADVDLRRRFAAAALDRAQQFTYDKVGAARRRQLQASIGG